MQELKITQFFIFFRIQIFFHSKISQIENKQPLQKPLLPSDHERALIVCDFYFKYHGYNEADSTRAL